MRIGEAARRAGVTPRALRYYEEQGLISVDRDHNGYRVYDAETVLLARDIARLLRAGLASEDVARFVHCLGKGDHEPPRDCRPLLDAFSERLSVLDERIKALTDLRDRVAGEIERMTGRLNGSS
ncbi:MerR family DNA-binding transcriptional regulator [Thermomonospora curvata]|uniref:Transcriptional regulator, MerR family n=1 Tax=Thermomonospora curvata (strain ATCC 19995 / DSM 43183 / JCM 3096 / KCTC 9072 / NBRC 15933 / NCIMB 10081 / Henssen B9) TaxID=471852 RepID=D1A751_THECD|nr:MerR family transcriptional regulator [Thermomonospora curvata]ACZ00257.1 transcriptional regulator, MerR family [Thermomonospora curvata DSM 43183]